MLQTRLDLLDRQVNANGITAQDVREEQAVLRTEINTIKQIMDKSTGGFIERLFGVLLTAKKGHILFIAGVIVVAILLVFFPERLAGAVVSIIEALKAP